MKTNCNVYQQIKVENSDRHGHVAIVYCGARLTYGELFVQAEITAEKLLTLGLRPGNRVVLRGPDSTAYVVLALALLELGAVQIPAATALTEAEVKTLCDQVGAEALISLMPLPDAAQQGWLEMTRFVCVGADVSLFRPATAPSIVSGLSELNPAFIRFTSGTTAASKGVIISHEAVIARTDSANAGLKIGSDDVVLWVLPMAYHFVVTILLFLRRGASIVISESPAALAMPQLFAEEKITLLYMSPFHYHLLCESSAYEVAMLKQVRLAVTTALPMEPTLAERFHAKFGVRPRQAYGIIEVGLPCIDLAERDFKPGMVGRPLPPCELRIKEPDETGIGVILLRSPGMFDGYLQPFCRRAELCEDGFFNTGDLGFVDEAGQLTIVGRLKNVINFAGMKIFPYEVEAVLRSFPAVADVSVYPVPDALYGETPHADIVFKTDAGDRDALLEQLRKFCYANLSAHQVPKSFNLRDRLERTASGKILRRTPS